MDQKFSASSLCRERGRQRRTSISTSQLSSPAWTRTPWFNSWVIKLNGDHVMPRPFRTMAFSTVARCDVNTVSVQTGAGWSACGLEDLAHARFLAEGQERNRLLFAPGKSISRLSCLVRDCDGQKRVSSERYRSKLLCSEAWPEGPLRALGGQLRLQFGDGEHLTKT
jgi:hypothetical protein